MPGFERKSSQSLLDARKKSLFRINATTEARSEEDNFQTPRSNDISFWDNSIVDHLEDLNHDDYQDNLKEMDKKDVDTSEFGKNSENSFKNMRIIMIIYLREFYSNIIEYRDTKLETGGLVKATIYTL
jgi:hypothetical protein